MHANAQQQVRAALDARLGAGERRNQCHAYRCRLQAPLTTECFDPGRDHGHAHARLQRFTLHTDAVIAQDQDDLVAWRARELD